MPRPKVIILAGPNGAGKSTAKRLFIPDFIPFINADEIAKDLQQEGHPTGSATDLQAGRLLLQRISEQVAERNSFAVETNLANRTLAQRIVQWQHIGYVVYLYYLWVPSPEFAIARVAQRVRMGGHYIPDETVRRRYYRGIQLLFSTYIPLVDYWRIQNSSFPSGPRLAARGVRQIRDKAVWQSMHEVLKSYKEE
jgi:predicted ABC-type ATPase